MLIVLFGKPHAPLRRALRHSRREPGLIRGVCLVAALLLAGCAAAVPAAHTGSGTVRVRLMHLQRAVPGAVVQAIRNPGLSFREERVSARSGEDGRTELALSPGAWFIAASSDRPPGLFGWYGSNPVEVRQGGLLEIAIPASPTPPPPLVSAVPPGEEAVAGAVVGEGGPVAGAVVAFYLDASTLLRGPGYLEVTTDGDGRFEARVSPGSYWLVARRRNGVEVFGPLEVGDDFGFYARNPLFVRSGERVNVRIEAVRVLKRSGWSGPSAVRTRVSGTIRDAAGRPIEGYRAFLHAQPAMLGKPQFVSEPSGPDGTFTIWVDREGTYYLGARAEIGKARGDREPIGLYRETADHAVTIHPGAGYLGPLEVVLGADAEGGRP